MMHNTSQLAIRALEYASEHVREEFSKLPDSGEVTEKVLNKLRNTFENPPTSGFEAIIHKTFTDDEVRVALFQPSVEQVWIYVALLEVGIAAPLNHSFRKLMSLVLSLIFLIHRKEWDFIQEFVVSGGLEPLIQLLTDPSLYERSQALETILTITDCDKFDWFIPPANHSRHSTHVVQLMHNNLLNLGRNPCFLENLILNRVDSYPGGSFRALQFLAFWLSWVRALYTQDQKLCLSKKLLDEIRQWALPSDLPEEDLEEEKKLAQTLYDDFKVSVSDEIDHQLNGVQFPAQAISSKDKSISSIDQWKAVGMQQFFYDDAISTPPFSMEMATANKDEGNRFFRNCEFDKALQCYQKSLDILNQLGNDSHSDQSSKRVGDTEECQDMEIILRSNIANTFWKLYVENIENCLDQMDSRLPLLKECEIQCNVILEKVPFHIKATYRLVSVLLAKKVPKQAFDICTTMLSHLTKNVVNSKMEDIELFGRIKMRCVARAILEDQIIDSSEWGLSAQHIHILEALLKRNQLDGRISLSRIIVQPGPELFSMLSTVDSQVQNILLDDIDCDKSSELIKMKHSPFERKASSKEKKMNIKIAKPKKKLTADEKQLIQRLKVLGSKCSDNDINVVVEAKAIADQVMEKDLSIADVYPILMEETDVLLWLTIMNNCNDGIATLKLAEFLGEYERIQSSLFMVKMEKPELVERIAVSITSLLPDHSPTLTKSSQKLIADFLKALK